MIIVCSQIVERFILVLIMSVCYAIILINKAAFLYSTFQEQRLLKGTLHET